MAADPSHGAESGLFAVDELAHTIGDQRSVGEMLWDADCGARELLGDVDSERAASLLRSWPALVAAAGQLWGALPDADRQGPYRHDNQVANLQEAAQAVEARLRRDGPGPARDPRMTRIAADFTRAARLVARFGGQAATWRYDVQRDLAAARARTMHTLYVATHAVVVALRAQRHGQTVDTGPTSRWIVRMTACENLAGRAADRLPHALSGEAPRSPLDPDRLQHALTRWDLQVHRTLAREPSVTNLEAVARTEAGIASIGQILIAAAHHRQALPTDLAFERLDPTLGRFVGDWRGLARRWADLRTPTMPIDADLARVAGEVRAAFRELAHDGTTMAPIAIIAERPATGPAATAVTTAASTSPERAQLVADHADNEHLSGPARTIARRIRDDIAAGVTDTPVDENAAWVSPADIAAARVIPAPPPIVDGLRAASTAVEAAAATVSSLVAPGSGGTRSAPQMRHSPTTRHEIPPASPPTTKAIRP